MVSSVENSTELLNKQARSTIAKNDLHREYHVFR